MATPAPQKMMVHVYLTPEEKRRIEERAREIGISVSAYIKVKLFAEANIR